MDKSVGIRLPNSTLSLLLPSKAVITSLPDPLPKMYVSLPTPPINVSLRCHFHNQPLAQRVIMRYTMNPLSKEEVKQYINYQLKLARANHEIFSPQAIEAIASRSRGFPRWINNLASNCLLFGCAKQLTMIDEEAVFSVASEAGL